MTFSNNNSDIFKVLEVENYEIDFHVVQSPTKLWRYCLNIFPAKGDHGVLREDEIDENFGVIKKSEHVNGLFIYSQEYYSQWEYAAEHAIDAIELLTAIEPEETPHDFKVLFCGDDGQYVDKTGVFDSDDFFLIKEEDEDDHQ